jgi:hypothetical protein
MAIKKSAAWRCFAIELPDTGAKRPGVSLVAIGDDNLVDKHVVTLLDIVDADLRVLFDSRSINHLPVGCHVGNGFAEPIMNRLTRSRAEDERGARAELRNRAEVLGYRCGGFRTCASRRSCGRTGGLCLSYGNEQGRRADETEE